MNTDSYKKALIKDLDGLHKLKTKMLKKRIQLLMLALGCCGVQSCSQYSEGIFSKAYHNTNAKYNAYLQAKDLMKVAEQTLLAANQEDFSKMLPILLPIDSLKSKAVATQLEAVIKKASIVAERHQNSKWLDDAYLLIGKARLLKEDYANATETFKYINTQSENENTKHTALINLMRAYLEQDDQASAMRVAEYLREQDLNKINTRDYYLTKAYLHQQKGEYDVATGILEEAFKLMKKSELTARVHFAAGQMYDAMGQPQNAIVHYKAVEKNNPTYDLSFNANLNALMNSPGNGGDGKIDQNFKAMLGDRKNNDLQDKIYLTMAQREQQAKNYKQAVVYYKTALQKANGNQNILWQSYLALGEIHYGQFQAYELAKAYYDSTMITLPPNSKSFALIDSKKKSLDDFVKQILIIRTEDSLQRLANMNPTALDKYLDKILNDKVLKEKKDLELAQQMANKIVGGGQLNRGQAGLEGTSFYFYDPNNLLKGKDEFIRTWGTRRLEDNWRRANKGLSTFSNEPSSPVATKGTLNAVKLDADNMASSIDIKAEKEAIMQKIPFGEAEKTASRAKQEEAYFVLGKIYKLNLNENQNAITTFEKTLSLFPNTKHEEEILYLLCLLTENQGNNASYKAKIAERYGNGYYARLLNRSSANLSTGADSDAQKLYNNAYKLYKEGAYTDAMIAVDNGLRNYPNNTIEDKFALLKAILLGKSQQLPLYQKTLEEFVRDYPSSQLVPIAKEMLAVAVGNKVP